MNKVTPKIRSSKSSVLGLTLAAILIGVGTVIFLFNPATHHFYPVCQFHQLTGLNCPSCGLTRATYALAHGQFKAALKDNALFVGLLGVLAVRGAWIGWQRWKGRSHGAFLPTKYLGWLLAIAMVFAVLRNLPALAFLAP